MRHAKEADDDRRVPRVREARPARGTGEAPADDSLHRARCRRVHQLRDAGLRYNGHAIAGFLATAKGCSYFPFSGTTLSTMASDIAAYSQTKSALHFDPKRPLPVALVRKLLKARIAEMSDRV